MQNCSIQNIFLLGNKLIWYLYLLVLEFLLIVYFILLVHLYFRKLFNPLSLLCGFSASVDVDRIVREMDVKTLQDNIMHVTFSNIEAELVSAFMV